MNRLLIANIVVCVVGAAACAQGVVPTQPSNSTTTSLFGLQGTVREKLPNGTTALPIASARVEVIAKSGAVRSIVADAEGRYSVVNLAGSFELRVSKDGFETSSFAVGPMREDLTFDMAIPPILRTLQGFVVESPPTQTTPLPAARIEIVTGSNAGLNATSDETGAYSLPAVWGEFDIRVTRTDYQTRTSRVRVDSESPRADVQIDPAPRVLQETHVRGSLVGPASFVFPVHNPGHIEVNDVSFLSFEEGDTMSVQLLEEGRVIAETSLERSFPRNKVALRVAVDGGKSYEVRTGGQWRNLWNVLSFAHPN